MNKQIHVFYTGSVQGVGFRLTTQDVANKVGINGWVKNLPNGQVEIVAEAEEDKLKSFLEQMNQTFTNYIQSVDVQWLEATDKFITFGVRF